MKCPISPNCFELEGEAELALHLLKDHEPRHLVIAIVALQHKIELMIKGEWKE